MAATTSIVTDAVNARLEELRRELAVKRQTIRDWRRQPWRCQPARRVACVRSLQGDIKAIEAELRSFIREHRELMGPAWVGNDHGRLCLRDFLGGLPIDRHFCQLEEGHSGFCQNDVGAWPKGVTSYSEWRWRQEACEHTTLIQWQGETFCGWCAMSSELIQREAPR